MKIRTRLIAANAVIVLVAITIATTYFLLSFRSEMTRQARIAMGYKLKTMRQLLNQKGPLRVDGDRLYAGEHLINDNFEIPDIMARTNGGVATIFLGDLRISTNVTKADGSRAVGTRLQGPARTAVFDRKQSYEGEVNLFGEPYFAAYEPITDASGAVIGALFVGVKKSDFLSSFMSMAYAGILIAVGLAAFSAIFVFVSVRRMFRPIDSMIQVIGKAAAGDLSVRCATSGNDEMASLGKAVNVMLTDIGGALAEVVAVSGEVEAAVACVCSESEKMASGAEEVSSQTEMVATASEEMAATSSNIASNCSLVAESSRQADTRAHAGAEVVSGTIAFMTAIAEKVRDSARTVERLGSTSERIGEIVRTIEDIADQTNLLALNAAIEAARAGEQGRGFAVVADEVRALAERTGRATKEISEMIANVQHDTLTAVRVIEEGVAEVEKGTAEATKSGEALEAILREVGNVTMQVSQIATAAEEQTATTTEITTNILRIRETVHDTSRGAEHNSEAARTLALHASDLLGRVQRFTFA